MPKTWTRESREAIHRTAPADYMLMLMTIEHPLMSEPARVVNDTQNLVGPGGHTFIAAAFEVTLPDDRDRELSLASLKIDNVGRDLTDWIEASQGGKNATVTIMIVNAGDPTVVEDEFVLSVKNMQVNTQTIPVSLGYENFLNLSGVAIAHDTAHSPGLY